MSLLISLITRYLLKQMEHFVHYMVDFLDKRINTHTHTRISLALLQIAVNLAVYGWVLLI